MAEPIAIDLFCGLGGWTDGLIAEGYRVFGFDNERHEYDGRRYPGSLVIQDVRTLHGAQFRDAALIVASPPCQEYSYMAMPWTVAKAKAAAIRADDSGAALAALNCLFDACFRIQREACEAAGRHIPLIVENVRGAQDWVGRARWNFGSFYLWGDVPALMPAARKRKAAVKVPSHTGKRTAVGNGVRFTSRDCGIESGFKSSGMNWSDRSLRGQDFTRIAGNQAAEGRKQPGISGPRANGKGDRWFQDGAARHGSKSASRKKASAEIAMIPLTLSRHIAKTYHPENNR